MGLVFVDRDIGSLLGIDPPDGRCGAMYLDDAALRSFEAALPVWEQWQAALASNVVRNSTMETFPVNTGPSLWVSTCIVRLYVCFSGLRCGSLDAFLQTG